MFRIFENVEQVAFRHALADLFHERSLAGNLLVAGTFFRWGVAYCSGEMSAFCPITL
jgi:hypothetical protein